MHLDKDQQVMYHRDWERRINYAYSAYPTLMSENYAALASNYLNMVFDGPDE